MSYIDDLNEGEYIAVTSVNGEPRSKRGDHLDGHPFLIIAISLPFIVTEDMMGGRCSMDMRFIEVQKVSKQYADAHRPKRGKRKVMEEMSHPPVEMHDAAKCPYCKNRKGLRNK